MHSISKCAVVALMAMSSVCASAKLTNDQIFSRPVNSEVYGQQQWVLKNGSELRETAEAVGQALAGLKPSYVSGLIYLEQQTEVNDDMIADWNTIRSKVLATVSNAKFDVEISMNPNPSGGKEPFTNASAVVAKLKELNTQLSPDGFWFDFYSDAQKSHPDWIQAAIKYAHS